MARRLIILVLILSTMLGRAVSAQDPGDHVLYKGTAGAPEINESIIKEAGNRVLTDASSVSERVPVQYATTGNITLSGEQAIDQPASEEEEGEGDTTITTSLSRVLVWQQFNPAENGIYLTSPTAWVRSTDTDEDAELVNHFTVYVQSGVLYGQTVFRLTTIGPIDVGTTPITFEPMPRPVLLALWQLPANPAVGTTYTVSEQNGTCQAPGLLTGPCWWDGGTWQPMGSGGGSLANLTAVCAVGTDCALTNLPPERPFIRAPEGLGGVQLRTYGQSGSIMDDCVDGSTLFPCQPSYNTVYPGQTKCLEMVILDDPATEVCLNSLTVTEAGGIGTGITRSDRGPFADRPSDPYLYETYLVTNCLDATCAAGGGTVVIHQMWNGTVWANITGSAGAGDITQVWGCTTGDCSTLTAAAGDSLNATNADSVIPQPVTTTLPATCIEGRQYHDSNSGGSETYKCTATDVWTKLQAVLPWEIPFSSAGLVVDGTNCVGGVKTQINSGPQTFPIICSDAPGTLELSFLSPTRWDGTALTVSFVVADTTTSGHVWSANVEGQCRTLGTEAINSTWSTPVAATVTMVTASVPYAAVSVISPNTGCVGGDWVAIRATINNATTHTDASARVLGGSIRGNQL